MPAVPGPQCGDHHRQFMLAVTQFMEFHGSVADLQLVIAGYASTYSVLLITDARLGDRPGLGRVHPARLARRAGAPLIAPRVLRHPAWPSRPSAWFGWWVCGG